jgi:flagellar motor component MotA
MIRFLFVALGSALFAAAIIIGSDFMTFVNLPSVLIVVGGTVCFSLAHHCFDDIKAAIQGALGNQAAQNPQKDIAVLATLRKTTYGSGVLGTLIGLIQMLQNLDDAAKIGPAMAVALLTALYSVMIVEFLIDPLVNRILAKSESKSQTPPVIPPAQSAHAVGMVFSATLCFFVLIQAFN